MEHGPNPPARRRPSRDEEGSLMVTVMVMIVVSAMIVALLVLTDSGLRQSRIAGEEANALQLADAGVNDAVRQVTLALNDNPISIQKNLGGAGSYDVQATKIAGTKSWRVESQGTDSAGARRRVVADAVPEELFSNAFFSQSSLVMASGSTVDSFLNGMTRRNMCTGKGVVGSNTASQMTWNNNGQGDTNCREWAGDAGFDYSFDACISYAREDPSDFDPLVKCPPDPLTMKRTPAYEVPYIDLTNVTPVPQPDAYRNCTSPIPPGIYYWQSVTLGQGCSLQGTTGDVVIYSFGPVTLGSGSANDNFVNRPPDDPGICPHDHAQQGGRDALTDQWNDPAHYYCPNWAKRLQIWVKSGANGTVSLTNHLKFWGLLVAPTQAIVAGGGNGSPHVFVWGAIVGQTANLNAQFTMHYDESLAQMSSSTYRIRNWREAPPQ